MTHEERQALIQAPFHFSHRVPPKSWAGALITPSSGGLNPRTGEYGRVYGRVHNPIANVGVGDTRD